MQTPAGVEDFCTTYADCTTRYPDAMAKWDAFFQVHAHKIHMDITGFDISVH